MLTSTNFQSQGRQLSRCQWSSKGVVRLLIRPIISGANSPPAPSRRIDALHVAAGESRITCGAPKVSVREENTRKYHGEAIENERAVVTPVVVVIPREEGPRARSLPLFNLPQKMFAVQTHLIFRRPKLCQPKPEGTIAPPIKLCLKIEGTVWFRPVKIIPGASATIHLTDSEDLGMKSAIVWVPMFP